MSPWTDEIKKAITQMNSDTTSGKDGIAAEACEAAGCNTLNAFHDVLLSSLEDEDMPETFRDAVIIALYESKGIKADCGNYRRISLQFIAGKLLARTILNRPVYQDKTYPTLSVVFDQNALP